MNQLQIKQQYDTPKLRCNCVRFRHPVLLLDSSLNFEFVTRKSKSVTIGTINTKVSKQLKTRLKTPQLSRNCMRFRHPVLFLDSSFSFTTNVLEVVTTARCACCTWWLCAGGAGSRFRLLFPKYHETSVRPLSPLNHIRYLDPRCYMHFIFFSRCWNISCLRLQ